MYLAVLPRAWPRPSMLDVMGGIAAATVVASSTALVVRLGSEATARPVGFWGYALVVLAGGALTFRTVAPMSTFVATLALGMAYQAAGYHGGPAPLPVVVALYTLAAQGRRQRALGLGLAAIVLLFGARVLAVHDGLASPLLIAFPTTVIAALYAGQMVSARRLAREDAARAAAERDRSREDDARRRVDAERLRIARELHDVVAHNISLINVQATMGSLVIDRSPDQAAEALTEIRTASRQALGELRRVLNVLRQVDDAEPTAPVPGLSDLEAMVLSTTTAGLPIRLTVHGEVVPLPAMVDVAAFRIVQESLTNALRYAAPAPTEVTLRFRPGCLTVEVVDEGRRDARLPVVAGSGHGIAGMRERAAAVGGTLTAGPTGAGGFRVLAELPLPPSSP